MDSHITIQVFFPSVVPLHIYFIYMYIYIYFMYTYIYLYIAYIYIYIVYIFNIYIYILHIYFAFTTHIVQEKREQIGLLGTQNSEGDKNIFNEGHENINKKICQENWQEKVEQHVDKTVHLSDYKIHIGLVFLLYVKLE